MLLLMKHLKSRLIFANGFSKKMGFQRLMQSITGQGQTTLGGDLLRLSKTQKQV